MVTTEAGEQILFLYQIGRPNRQILNMVHQENRGTTVKDLDIETIVVEQVTTVPSKPEFWSEHSEFFLEIIDQKITFYHG